MISAKIKNWSQSFSGFSYSSKYTRTILKSNLISHRGSCTLFKQLKIKIDSKKLFSQIILSLEELLKSQFQIQINISVSSQKFTALQMYSSPISPLRKQLHSSPSQIKAEHQSPYELKTAQPNFTISINGITHKPQTAKTAEDEIKSSQKLSQTIQSSSQDRKQGKQSYVRKSTGNMKAALSIKNKFSSLNKSLCTPKKQKYFQPETAHSQEQTSHNNFINSFREVQTIQTKFHEEIGTTHIQQSQIVFKGSRDVKDIVPLRLNYDEEIQKLVIVRKSEENILLVRQQVSLGMFGLVKLKENEEVRCFEHGQIMQVYDVYDGHKEGDNKILVIEPYEYTFKELIWMGTINSQNSSIVLKKLGNAIQFLFSQSFFSSSNFEIFFDHIYYIHGKFKILPISSPSQLLSLQSIFQKLALQLKNTLDHQ